MQWDVGMPNSGEIKHEDGEFLTDLEKPRHPLIGLDERSILYNSLHIFTYLVTTYAAVTYGALDRFEPACFMRAVLMLHSLFHAAHRHRSRCC